MPIPLALISSFDKLGEMVLRSSSVFALIDVAGIDVIAAKTTRCCRQGLLESKSF